MMWFAWLLSKFQTGLLGSLIAFSIIAFDACGHQVVPGVHATARTGNHMVQSEWRSGFTTVLTLMIVSSKNISTR